MMRTFFLLSFAFFLLTGRIAAQTNTSVRAAKCVLEGTYSETIDLASSGNCIGGGARLYYQFIIDHPGGGTITVGNSWAVSSGNLSYKVYGPYADLTTGHTAVESGTEFPTASSVSPSSSQTITLGTGLDEGDAYILEILLDDCSTTLTITNVSKRLFACQPVALTCDDCLGQFQPTAGQYVFSAWTKEEGAAVTKTSYTYPSIGIETDDGTTTTTFTFTPSGEIIDGWQQITGTFDVPPNMTSLELSLNVGGSGQSALFDDIRMFPFDGSMMSYVYDPVTLRLVAELDERNYAKLYEYDEEGKLVRVKKETEKGIMTITENRENSVKK